MALAARTGPKSRSTRNGNHAISAQLLAKFTSLIEAVTFKMGATYSLAKEDRDDLQATVTMKIFSVDWIELAKKSHGRDPSDYCRSLILNSMRKEVRRIKTNGFRGLEAEVLGQIPQPFDDPLPDRGRDGIEGRVAAAEIVEKARNVLTPAQFLIVEMLFGFDGGGERTIEQTARELGMPRREVSELSLQAIEALRAHLKIPSVSFS